MNKKETEALIDKLIHHDWYYEYSDDHRVWKQGRDEVEEIAKIMQKANLSEEELTSLRKQVLAIVMPHDEDHKYIAIWYERFEFLKRKIYDQQVIADSSMEA